MKNVQDMLYTHPNNPVARSQTTDDPQVRRMLASHTHCGEPMSLVSASPAPLDGRPGERENAVLTYRCACGFSFDARTA